MLPDLYASQLDAMLALCNVIAKLLLSSLFGDHVVSLTKLFSDDFSLCFQSLYLRYYKSTYVTGKENRMDTIVL